MFPDSVPPRPRFLAAIDDELRTRNDRLREIVDTADPSAGTLNEVMSIYSDVAFLAAYLEGNRPYVDDTALLHWRDAFFADRSLLTSLAELLSAEPDALGGDPGVGREGGEVRSAFVAWLHDQAEACDRPADQELAQLEATAQQTLVQLRLDQADLLERLGLRGGGAVSPAAIFYRSVSATEDAQLRAKIVRASDHVREQRVGSLIDVLDQMAEARRRSARAEGFATVLERTFLRCDVSVAGAQAFLDASLRHAVNVHARLAAEVAHATGCPDRPMDHFGYYLRTVTGGAALPTFPLDPCLDFLFKVAERVLGVSAARVGERDATVITVALRVQGHEVGRIAFDLADAGSTGRPAAGALGGEAAFTVRSPAARVLCRVRTGPDGVRGLTFDNVHSVFHDFGRALTHLLVRKRRPSSTGLDQLPLERLEDLGMCWEKWVYGPDFAGWLALSAADAEGLTRCRRVKALETLSTALQRAVVAALDFDVHRKVDGGLRDSYWALDQKFELFDNTRLSDLPGYLTLPISVRHPGATFVKVWGAASGAQRWQSLLGSRLADLPPAEQLKAAFSSCFDPDESSVPPDVAAESTFYQAARG